MHYLLASALSFMGLKSHHDGSGEHHPHDSYYPDFQPDTYLGSRHDARHEFWHNTWATLAAEQHMNGWSACLAEWEESHLNWDLGKKEVHQWFDHHLKWQGVKRINHGI